MISRGSKERDNIFLGILCLIIIIGLFLVGLWPLNFRAKNEVAWLPDENGIRFHGRGIAYSQERFDRRKEVIFQDESLSIEIWLKADTEHYRYLAHIFSLYDGKRNLYFALCQWKSFLEIMRNRKIDERKFDSQNAISLRDGLPSGKRQFIAVTSGTGGTKIYLNGKAIIFNPKFSLMGKRKNISGQFILGNSPTGKHPWVGDIFGLAVHNRVLSEEEVSSHYRKWKRHGLRSATEYETPAVLFSFDEGKGGKIHNHAGPRSHLLIPETFHVLKKIILEKPWNIFQLSKSRLKDVLVNIIGFVPFGFILFPLLKRRKKMGVSRIYTAALLTGGAISLGIELMQVYLPGRSSSLTDLICNTFGAILGVAFFHLVFRNHD